MLTYRLGKKVDLKFNDLGENETEFILSHFNLNSYELEEMERIEFFQRVYVNTIEYSTLNGATKFLNSCIKIY